MISSRQITKSDNIDFVKYLAAVMVIVGHSFVLASKNMSVIASFLNNHISFGAIGVAIFFFLSGFLVTRSMIQKKTAREYFKVRVRKIIPPLFVVIPVTAFVLGPCVTTLSLKEYFSAPGTYKYLLNIVLIRQHYLPGVFENNPYPGAVNGSLWTLLFEFLCYIATYVAYKLKFLNKSTILIPIPAVVIGVVILFAVSSNLGISYSYLSSIVKPCICYYMGMILFFYCEYWINSKMLTVSVILTLIGIITCSVYFFLIFVIPILLLNIGWGIPVSVNPKIAYLGRYSYGIYLVAFPIQQLLVYVWENMGPFVNSIVTIILSTYLGKQIYKYIELPMSGKQVKHDEYNHYDKLDYVFAICAYGESPYLEGCILSLLNQSIPTGIIMVTSTPNEYIETMAAKYNLKVYVNHGPKGIAEDWNFGYQQADGNIVTLAHQDDIYEPCFAQKNLEKINRAKHPLISFSDYGEIRDGNRVVSNRLLNIKRIMLLPLHITKLQRVRFVRRRILSFGSPICCPSVTYVKKNLPDTIFESGYKGNMDWQAWEKLSKLKGSFVYCNDVLMFHRIHPESATSVNIAGNDRTKEDYEMFCKFWPKKVAGLIEFFYRSGEKSNEI